MRTNQVIHYGWIILKFSIVLFMLSPMMLMAQSSYKLASAKDNTIKVLGKSNVHDWTMVAKGLESSGTFKFDKNNELVDLTSFRFSVLAKSLKSDKTSMDERTYKAMKADQFPKVNYQLTFATVTMVQANKYSIQTSGNLTIAGKTQVIAMKVMALVNADGSITCHGQENLILTDYGIQPPSFMLGAMKVGNDLSIQFNLTYAK
jgi:polyisoprenoid-binding protein YceI